MHFFNFKDKLNVLFLKFYLYWEQFIRIFSLSLYLL